LEQVKALNYGDILYHVHNRNANGTPQRWRVNGKVKTWKRTLRRIEIPVRHGLRNYDYLTEDGLHSVCLTEEEATAYQILHD